MEIDILNLEASDINQDLINLLNELKSHNFEGYKLTISKSTVKNNPLSKEELEAYKEDLMNLGDSIKPVLDYDEWEEVVNAL